MRVLIPMFLLLMIWTSDLKAQVPISQIDGFLEVSVPDDFTSLYIGDNVGQQTDMSELRFNTFVGQNSGFSNTSGRSNSFFGRESGFNNTQGEFNSFYGSGAGYANTSGSDNSFFGMGAGSANISGESNSFFGRSAGSNITGGDNNILIGAFAGPNSSDRGVYNNRLMIDVEQSLDPLIYGEFDNNLVRINGELQLGPNTFAGGVGGDEGIIKSPRSSGSDIFVIANDGIQVRIGEVDAQEGTFEIFNGAENDQIFYIREDGFTKIDGDLEVTGTINGMSDINRKETFVPINSNKILNKISNLPITEWQYKGSSDRHIGPMAQDFYAAFGLGQGETTIATVDADGVALAAIQALAKENEELEKRSERLEKTNEKLEARLMILEKMILDR